MSWNQFQGDWQQFLGATKATWGDLTESDLAQTEGKRAALVALVQAKYGVASREAARQVNNWEWSYQIKANPMATRMSCHDMPGNWKK
ncbi:CsbD family protein [uncultured Thiodictyon sp.]|uniref:CsbD family protein n=1 Tax=uncultured Thiodictyon sp. TaxID=1846217 RepID=UPI0025CE71E8|nr:CsbD family protein [uncultured Thiodictyon sp.]